MNDRVRKVVIVMVIDGHDWKERVTYHPAPSYRIERHPGELVCFTCGTVRGPNAPECHEAWSRKTGFPAVSEASWRKRND